MYIEMPMHLSLKAWSHCAFCTPLCEYVVALKKSCVIRYSLRTQFSVSLNSYVQFQNVLFCRT